MTQRRQEGPGENDKPSVRRMEQSLRKARSVSVNVARSLSPTSHRQATHQVVVEDEFDRDVAFKVAFVGTGQGGGRMANAFHSLGYRRAAVVNTTDKDWDGVDARVCRLNLGIGGSAKDPALAANALKGREEEVWDLYVRAWGNELDYALVCVGLGGGSGSGTCVRLVDVARRYMESRGRAARVGAVVSLPPVTEGQQIAKNAVQTFKALLDAKISPLIIIDNARINELYKPGMTRLHAQANETVSQLFHLFNELAAVHSPFITFDRSELAQLLDGGIVVMGAADLRAGEIGNPADVSTKIRDELGNNVLAKVDIRRGRKAACLFVGSQEVLDEFSLDYFDAGFTQLDRMVGSASNKGGQTVIHRGVYLGGEEGLQCYVMVSELEPPVERLGELAKKAQLEQLGQPRSLAAYLGVQD
jgi:cell division GTPase FtsZ